MAAVSARRNVRVSNALHPRVYGALAGCTLAIVAAIWAFFFRDAYSAVWLAVCTVFAAMFLATPLVLARLSGRRAEAGPFQDWVEGEMELIDGTIEARHAVVMALTAPVACCTALAAIGLLWRAVSLGLV